jgi:hypothetical protein
VALEYMAQCGGTDLLDGLEPARAAGGRQRLALAVDRFAPDESLEVSAHILQRVGRLASLSASCARAVSLAEATLRCSCRPRPRRAWRRRERCTDWPGAGTEPAAASAAPAALLGRAGLT